jgi:hypothetical protein
MRPPLRFAAFSLCALAGCHTPQESLAKEALVGSYIYHSEDPLGRAADHNLDQLVLRSDGTYELAQGGSTKPRTETHGTWTTWNSGSDGLEVLLDHAGYPIQTKGNEVRLLIDNDVGIWYAKAK